MFSLLGELVQTNGFHIAHPCLFVLAFVYIQHLKITFELLPMGLSIYMFLQMIYREKKKATLLS